MYNQDSTGRGRGAKNPLVAQIDENLKRVYQSNLTDDVPDRFKQLLEQLKAKEAGK
jgi:hypothetical protein